MRRCCARCAAPGEVPALPKYTVTAVSRCLKAEAGPYQELAAAYAKPAAELQRVAAQHQAAVAEARPAAGLPARQPVLDNLPCHVVAGTGESGGCKSSLSPSVN